MKKLLLLISTVFALQGCYYNKFNELQPTAVINGSDCDTTNKIITYAAHIKPIVDAKCVSCHNTSAAGFIPDYTVFSEFQTRALSGLVYTKISTGAMPKGGPKLSDCEIGLIKKWADSGALNN